MNKETKLTLKLKGMGVENEHDPGSRYEWLDDDGENTFPIWTIESALEWLREKGYIWAITPEDIPWDGKVESMRISAYRWSKGKFGTVYQQFVKPGHELEGLLECMVKIVEGER